MPSHNFFSFLPLLHVSLILLLLLLLLFSSIAPVSAVLATRGQEAGSGEEERGAEAVPDTTGTGRTQAEAARRESQGRGGEGGREG